MSDTVPRPPEPTRPSDETLLRAFAATGFAYPALVAFDLDVAPTEVERRCVELERLGLVERVTDEPVYRVTAAGRDALAGHVAA